MDHFLSLQSTPYNSQSRAQSLPLVKSDHKCFQSYRDGILLIASCHESHQFRPFSNGESGAVTKVVQNLVYKTTNAEGKPRKSAVSTTRTTLHFQHTLEWRDPFSRAQTIVTALEELDTKTNNGVESDVPQVFSRLVDTLRTTSYPILAKVFSRTRDQHTRKFLLDAMPLVGTADGLTIMTDLYKSGEITEAEMDSWLTSLTFIKKPTLTMLLAVSSLLDSDPRPKAVLGISALVHSYCQWDGDCHKKPAVMETVNKMEKLLGDGCHVKGRHDMERKILALKGIGNAGIFPTSLRTLTHCYQRSDIPIEVRLAAIGAHRRFHCDDAWRSGLLAMYTDMKQDSELRIAAYLTVMQCPSAGTLQKIKATLYTEEVNQVASFVWTHLTNIQETATRWKQSIRYLISNDFLRNKFQTDARKFSRNYEGSAFVDSLNAGATVESNVIFSPQSYLPRSAALNLTVDLFGETINVFEVGTRAEGFEQIIEDMFGPGGYFPDKSLKQVLEKARGDADNELENSIDELADAFNAKSKLAKEPQASMYARVFGNEIHYSRYQGIEEMMGGHPHVKNPLEFIAQLFGGQDIDFTNSFVFIDASYKIPTVIGLPLDFSVNGSATVGLKMNGQVDLRDLWKKNAFNVQGQIMPSAAVEVTGTMSIDAFITKSGLQTVSTLHTNTYLDGKATVMGGQLIDVQINVPREKVEVLEVTSRMFVLHRNAALEVDGVVEDREVYLDCSLETVSKITGMKLCTELAYPNASLVEGSPYFPLTGPVTVRIELIKTDIFDSYNLRFQQLTTGEFVRTFVLSLDTPNSRINRKLEGVVSFDLEESSLSGSLLTPFVKLEMQTRLGLNDTSKSLSFGFRKNDEDVLKTQVALTTSNNGHLKRYEPSFTLYIPKTLNIDLVGKVNYVEGTKYSADFTLAGLTDQPLLFSTDVTAEGNKYELVGQMKSPSLSGSLHANLRQTNNYISTKVTVEYAVPLSKLQTISLAGKIQSNFKGDLYKKSAFGSLKMSMAPQYNALLAWDLISGMDYVEHSARLGLGPTEWQMKQLYRNHVRGNDATFVVQCQFQCPVKNVDYQFDVQYKTTDSSVKTHALVQLNAQHRFFSTVNFLRIDNQQELSAEVTCPWFSTLLNGEIVETQPNHFATKMEGRHTVAGFHGSPSHKRSLTFTSVYIDASSATHQDHKLEAELSGEVNAVLSAGLAAALDKSNQWLEVKVADKRYRADVTYTKNTHYIVESTFQLVDRTYYSKVVLLLSDKYKSLDVDLHLSKRLLFNAAILNDDFDNGISLELFWDRDDDLTKRIALNAHANPVTQEALLEFPGQYIKGEINTLPNKVDALLEWAEDQKIFVNLEWNTHSDGAVATGSLTTPFSGLKSQNATAKYNYGTTNCHASVNLEWQDQALVFFANGDKLDEEGTIGVEIKLTSTVSSLSDVHINMKHTYQPALKQCVYVVRYNNQKVVDASWYSHNTVVTAELAFIKPSHTLPSLHGKLDLRNGNITARISYANDRSVLLQLSTDLQFSKSGLFQIITPYSGLKNITSRFSYFNNGMDLKISADVDHNNNISSLLFSGSKTTNFVLGSGIFTTPFMNPVEAGFTHSTQFGVLKEGLSVTLDGQQMVLVSLVGTYRSFGDLKLTTDLTMPDHSVIASIENRLGASIFESLFEGVWNEDQIAASLVAESTQHALQLIAAASGSALSREIKFAVVHKRTPGSQYSTVVHLPDDIVMSHTLLMEDTVNWENKIEINTPLRKGVITNRQSLTSDSGETKFAHVMLARGNGQHSTVRVNYIVDTQSKILKVADGVLTTPWTSPVTIDVQLPMNATTILPKLKIQYNTNKEISFESLVQLQPKQSKFQMEVKSPFCKPITVNAFYDISIPTKVALMTVRWDDKQMDLKTTVHFESKKAMGVLVATRSDVEGPIVNAQFKYDVSKTSDMSGHIKALYRDKKLEVDLSGGFSQENWNANCELISPFDNWETLSAMFDVDLSKPTMKTVLSISRNAESISLSGSAFLTPDSSKVSLALSSSIPNVKSFSLVASVDEIPHVSHIIDVNWNYAGYVTQLSAGLDWANTVGEGLLDIKLTTPVVGFEDFHFQGRYGMTDSSKKSWGFKIVQNKMKVEMESTCLWQKNGDGEAAVMFVSTIRGLEDLSIVLQHSSLPLMKSQIVLKRNDEIVELQSSFIVTDNALTTHVECKTPIRGYETMSGKLVLEESSEKKSASLVLAQNDQTITAQGELKVNSLLSVEARASVTSPFENYETIQAGAVYNFLPDMVQEEEEIDSFGNKGNFYLDILGERNEINILLSYATSTPGLQINMELPLIMKERVQIEGFFNRHQRSLVFEGRLDDAFIVANIEIPENGLTATVKTSIVGLEESRIIASYERDPKTSMVSNGVASVESNNAKFSIKLANVFDPSAPELHLEIVTPILSWEKINIDTILDVTKVKKSLHFLITKENEKYETVIAWTRTNTMADCMLTLTTPIQECKNLYFNVHYDLTRNISAGISMQVNTRKIKGLISAAGNMATISIETPWKEFKTLSLSGHFRDSQGEKSLIVALEKNKESSQIDVTLTTDKDATYIRINSPFSICRTLSIALRLGGLFTDKTVSLVAIKNSEKIVELSAKFDLDKESRVGFNVNLSSPLLPDRFKHVELFAQYNIQGGEKNLMFRFVRNRLTVIAAKSNILHTEIGGFTYNIELEDDFHDFAKSMFVLEYNPQKRYIHSAITSIKDNQVDTYSGVFTVTNVLFQFTLSSPIQGYEQFSLVLKRIPEIVSVDFSTTFLYYDMIKLRVMLHDFKSNEENFILLSVQKDRDLINAEWKLQLDTLFAKSSVSLTTPYAGYKKFGLNLEYDLYGKNKAAMIALEKNNQTLKIESILLLKEYMNVEASLNVTTSFTYFEDIKFYGSYDLLKASQKNIAVMGHWNDDWNVDIKFKLENSTPTNAKIWFVSVTPYDESTFSITGSYDFSESDKSRTLEGALSVLKMKANFSAAFTDQPKRGYLRASFSQGGKSHNGNILWDLKNEMKLKSAQLVLDLGEGRKTVLYAEAKLDGMSNVNALVNFEDFSSHAYKLAADWNTYKHRTVGKFGYQWSDDKHMYLETEFKYEQDQPYSVNIKFTSPFSRNMNSIDFQNTWSFTRDAAVFTSALQLNPESKIVVGFKFDNTTFVLSFDSPLTEPVLLVVKRENARVLMDNKVYSAEASFSYGSWENEFTFNMSKRDNVYTTVVASLTTPIEGITLLRMKWELNEVKKEARLLLEKEHQKWELSGALSRNNHKHDYTLNLLIPIEKHAHYQLFFSHDVGTTLAIQTYFQLNKLKIASADLNVIPSELFLSMSSQIDWLPAFTVECEVKLTQYQVRVEGNVQNDPFKFQAGINTSNKGEIITQIDFSSPWTRDFLLRGTYRHDTNHEMKILLRNGEEYTDMVGSLHFKNEGSTLEIEFDSLVNNRGGLTLKTGYDWEQQLKKTHLTITFGDATFHARAQGQASADGLSGDVHIDTPFKDVNLVEFKVDISRTGHLSGKGSLLLRTNTNIYHLRYSTAYTANSFDGHLTVASPSFKIQDAVIRVKHGENFVFFTAGVDGKACDFEGSFQLERPASFLKFKLNVPFVKSLEHIEAAVDLNMNDSTFLYQTQWTDTEKIDLTLHFDFKDFNFRLQTPFAQLLTMEVSSKIQRTKDAAFNLIGKMTLNEMKVDLDGVLTIDPLNIDISSQAEWGTGQEAYVRSTFLKNKVKTSVNIAASVQGKDINIAGELETADLSNLVAKININIPFYGIAPISAMASLKQDDWREVDVQVSIPNAVYRMQANYVLVNNDLKIGLEFDMPIIKSSMVIGGSFNNNNFTDFDGSIFINNNKIAASYKLEDNVYTGYFDMNAPFFSIEDTRVDVQASTDFNPDIHSSVKYRYGKYMGSLSSSLLKSTNAFSVRLDLDIPSILGPLVHTGRLSATYLEPHYFAEVRLDDGRNVRSASLKIDSTTDWIVVATATGPKIDAQEVTVLLTQNWNLLSVNVMNTLIVEAKHDSNSGSVVVEYSGKEHKLEYQLNQQAKMSDFSLRMESSALQAKTITIGWLYENNDQNTQIVVQCVSGLLVNKASVQFTNGLNAKSVIFDVTRSSKSIIRVDVSNVNNHMYIQKVATLEWFGSLSNVTLKHSAQLHDAEMIIHSPYLKDNSLYAKLNVTRESVSAFVSLGEKHQNKYVSVVIKLDPSEKIGSFEFLAPQLDVVNTLKFNGVFKIYEEMFTMVSFNGYFSSVTISDAQISLGFLMSTTGIDTSIMVLTPFVDHKVYKAAVQVPFLWGDNNELHMSINLPRDMNYLLEAKFQNKVDNFEMGLLFEYESSKLGALVKLVYDPVPLVQLSLNTPFRLLKNYRMQFRGQNSLVDGDDIINYVEWSDKRIELRHSMIAGPKKVLYRVQLTTPFKGFERYVAGLHFEFDKHKKALITLGFPKIVDDWVIEFDFRFTNPRDLSFTTLIQVPVFTNFKVASFMIGNRFDAASRTYRGVMTGRYNDDEISIIVDGAVKAGGMNATMKAQLNDKIICLQAVSGFRERQVIEGLFELTSPFTVVNNFKVALRSSPLEPHKLKANVVYNSVELINATVFADESRLKTIVVTNPWRSFSVAYLFDIKEDVAVRGEICWDTNNKLTSQLGGGFLLTRGHGKKQDFAVSFKFPTRGISISGSRLSMPHKVEYASSFSWDYEQTFGYKIMFERNSDTRWNTLCRLDLPFRSFELTSTGDIVVGFHTDVDVHILWDAATNRDKKVGFTYFHNSWSLLLTMEHCALNYPIGLHFDHVNWNSNNASLSPAAKFTLEYSPLGEDLFLVGIEMTNEDAGTKTELYALHQASSLDTQIYVQASSGLENIMHKIGLRYIDSMGQKRMLEIYGKVSNTSPDIELSVQTSENSLSVNGSLWFKENGSRGVTVALAMNQKEPLSVEGRINTEELSTEVDIGYGNGRRYMFSAGMPSSRHVAVSARHTIFGTSSVDAQFALRLNTSRLIWTQVRWHRGLFRDMQQALLQEYTDVALVAENIVVSFAEFLNEDFVVQFEDVYSAVHKLFEDLQPNSEMEMRMVLEDFTEIRELLEEMYERNDLYLRDIHLLFQSSVLYVEEKAACLVKQILEVCGVTLSAVKNLIIVLLDTLFIDFSRIGVCFGEIQKIVVTTYHRTSGIVKNIKHLTETVRKSAKSTLVATRETIQQLDQFIHQLFNQVKDYSTQLVDQYSKAIVPIINGLQQHTMLMHNSFVAIERSLNELVVTVYNTLMSIKELRQLVEVYDRYATWVEEFRLQTCIDGIVQYFKTIGDILVEDFQRMFEDYKGYIDAALNVVSAQLEQVDRIPAVAFTKSVSAKICQKLSWLWKYHDLTDELRKALHLMLENADDIAAKLANDINADEPSPQLDSSLVVRPGYIELRQHLPIDWDSFFELPKFSQLTKSTSPTTNLGEFEKYQTYLMNAVSKVRPTLLDTDFLPPYGTSGHLVGKQHIVTFDNRFYDFQGECSYLLASHFVDNKFSVIVNYNMEDGKVAKKSFTVMSEGHRIDIGSNYRITVDGVKTELPAAVGNAVVILRDGNRIVLESENQMAVECYMHHDVCSVRLSGWYFGKTGGLLGTFDNEPSNDMALPDGNVTNDLDKFTSGWRVGNNGRCRLVNHATPMPVLPANNANTVCNSYFTDASSPLAACFAHVDPKPFLSMCLSDVSSLPGDLGVCATTIAYALECAEAGVEVEVLQECVRCNMPDGSHLIAGKTVKIEDNLPMSGDVVFVVEQAECIKNVNLAKLVSKLEMAMVNLGLTDNRFAVVGFGGDLFPPHTRTAKGEIWSNSRGIEKALQGLVVSASDDTERPSEVYEALMLAAGLSFRGGVSKTIVLVQCSSCSESLDYGDVMGVLLLNDITLHLLEPSAIELRGSATQSKAKVFGADLSGAYTARNVKSISPSSSLLKEVVLPTDSCSPLAFESNGTVFNLDRLTDTNNKQPANIKKFVDVWTRRVAQTALPSLCQQCDCIADKDAVGQMLCSKCIAPSPDTALTEWQNLMMENYAVIDAVHILSNSDDDLYET